MRRFGSWFAVAALVVVVSAVGLVISASRSGTASRSAGPAVTPTPTPQAVTATPSPQAGGHVTLAQVPDSVTSGWYNFVEPTASDIASATISMQQAETDATVNVMPVPGASVRQAVLARLYSLSGDTTKFTLVWIVDLSPPNSFLPPLAGAPGNVTHCCKYDLVLVNAQTGASDGQLLQ